MVDAVGALGIRKENIERIVKGLALSKYKFKNRVNVISSSAWKETFYQETKATLTAGGTRTFKGISRLATFPHAKVTWTEKNGWMVKHGAEEVISYEDAISDDLDVRKRILMRIPHGITASVDTLIWNTISESLSPSLINSYAISAGDEWDSATVSNQNPVKDILKATAMIAVDDYDEIYNSGEGELWLHPNDYANLLANPNIRNVGQFWTSDPTRKGTVGILAGLKIIVSNNVTEDYGLITMPKKAITYKELQSLRTEVIEDPLIKWTVRSSEIGLPELVNPEAVCLLSNLKA